MEKTDFKTIKKEHFESCREIIKADGECDNVECFNCPFWRRNWNHKCYETGTDQFIKYAKEFVKKF